MIAGIELSRYYVPMTHFQRSARNRGACRYLIRVGFAIDHRVQTQVVVTELKQTLIHLL